MNITKTELPTRPFTVKKFKLECEGKEYTVIEKQYECLIGGVDENLKAHTRSFVFTDEPPSSQELIDYWEDLYTPYFLIEFNP